MMKIRMGASLAAGCAMMAMTATAWAGSETVVYSFGGQANDGSAPYGSLIYENGVLYGTTFDGGANDVGVVFSVTPGGSETVLHQFGTGATDGTHPEDNLLDIGGVIYGTTEQGGAYGMLSPAHGSRIVPVIGGTVFKIAKTGKETVMHSFDGAANDGQLPTAGLVQLNGVLYGITRTGGANGCGAVFSITKAGVESLIYSFCANATDGSAPWGGLTLVNGTFYGTTLQGGANGQGTVFSLTPGGTETVLYSFQNGTDVSGPEAGVVYLKGALYGTTVAGGANGQGGVFAYNLTTSTETVLHSFSDSNGDGYFAAAPLIAVGNLLYGTAGEGGANGEGAVFSITPTGTEKIVYSFAGGNDGANPMAALIKVGGVLYGTTALGGANSNGTVFAVTP